MRNLSVIVTVAATLFVSASASLAQTKADVLSPPGVQTDALLDVALGAEASDLIIVGEDGECMLRRLVGSVWVPEGFDAVQPSPLWGGAALPQPDLDGWFPEAGDWVAATDTPPGKWMKGGPGAMFHVENASAIVDGTYYVDPFIAVWETPYGPHVMVAASTVVASKGIFGVGGTDYLGDGNVDFLIGIFGVGGTDFLRSGHKTIDQALYAIFGVGGTDFLSLDSDVILAGIFGPGGTDFGVRPEVGIFGVGGTDFSVGAVLY